jgi:hypothetical protein
MDKWDRDNLDFLLNASDEDFQQFLLDSSDDDIQYAIELIQTRKAEALVEIEQVKDLMFTEHEVDLSDARAVLARFRL